MKKFLSISLVLLLTCSIAQAQSTPEAIIGACPELPSAQALAAGQTETFLQSIKNLHERLGQQSSVAPTINEAELKSNVEQYQQKAVSDLERKTGKSLDQIQNMSAAEQEAMGRKLVDQQMAQSAGLGNMKLSDLEGKSEKEIEAMMMAQMAQSTGLTPQEIEAMSKMSDKQIEAYMKQGDRAKRVQNSEAAKMASMSPADEKKMEADGKRIEAMTRALDESQVYGKKMSDLEAQIKKDADEATAQIKKVYQKHKPAIDEAWNKVSLCWDGKTTADITKAYCDAAEARYKAVNTAYNTEAFGIWRTCVSKTQARYKAFLPEAQKMDALQKEADKAKAELAEAQQGKAAAALIQGTSLNGFNTYSIVSLYLNTAEAVVNLPSVEN